MILLVHTMPESKNGHRRATNLLRCSDLFVWADEANDTGELRAVIDISVGDYTSIAVGRAVEVARLFELITERLADPTLGMLIDCDELADRESLNLGRRAYARARL